MIVNEIKVVNNQELRLLDVASLQSLLKEDSLLSKSSLRRLFSVEVPLMVVEEQIYLYGKLVELPLGKKKLLYYPVLEIEADVLQKVAITTDKCRSCSWMGFIGNPLVADLYFDIESKEDLRKTLTDVNNLERASCPNCGADLNQPAIWTADLLPAMIELYKINDLERIEAEYLAVEAEINRLNNLIDNSNSFDEEIEFIKKRNILKEARLERRGVFVAGGGMNPTSELVGELALEDEISLELIRLLRGKENLFLSRGMPSYTHGLLFKDGRGGIQSSYSFDFEKKILAKDDVIKPASRDLFSHVELLFSRLLI